MPSVRGEIARFRHRVFVQKLGWQVKTSPACSEPCEGEEFDEYDHDETVYVTLRGHDDVLIGCARLLPARGRYLLGDHFAHLVDDLRSEAGVGGEASVTPVTPVTRVWELSRFACERPSCGADGGAFNAAEGARHLLRAAVLAARALGAERLIGVTFVSLARLFGRIGVSTRRLGVTDRIDGRWVAAYRIEIDGESLTALGLGAGAVRGCDEIWPMGAYSLAGVARSPFGVGENPKDRLRLALRREVRKVSSVTSGWL